MALFNSNFIYTGVEDDILLVGFADEEFERKEYLLVAKDIKIYVYSSP